MSSSNVGAKAAHGYTQVAAESGVSGADPHQLILMLYDGALASIHQARGHLAAGRVAEKGAAIGKAIRIIDEGLKVSVDADAGGQLAQRLLSLYDYLVMRLLQANLRNEEAALTEVTRHLNELRDAWLRIAPGGQSGGAPAADVGGQKVVETSAPSPTNAFASMQGVEANPRRVVVSA